MNSKIKIGALVVFGLVVAYMLYTQFVKQKSEERERLAQDQNILVKQTLGGVSTKSIAELIGLKKNNQKIQDFKKNGKPLLGGLAIHN